MIETQLNLFDAGVLAVMIISCLFAFFRGFVREILSLGAWLGAGIVTIYYFPLVAEKLQPHFKSAVVAAGFGTLGIYIAALMGFSIINMLILKFFKEGSEVGMLDNSLGLAFGAFRGAFIVSLGFFLITIVIPEDDYPVWLKKSMTRPAVEKGAIMLTSVLPEYLREISSLNEKAEDLRDKRKETREDREEAYNKKSSRQLDRLIDSTKGE